MQTKRKEVERRKLTPKDPPAAPDHSGPDGRGVRGRSPRFT
jgi:hypothetical protein